MSDEFERRVASALAAHVSPRDAAARGAIMDRVRQAAALGGAPRRRVAPWTRAPRHSIVGLALAAGIGGISTLSAVLPGGETADPAPSVVILGDTVVSTLRDTLRLVRLMFDAPSARSVSLAGDFNGWGARPLPMQRDPLSRRWAVTLALHAGAHRYAFVVDGTRWVPDPAAERSGRDTAGRVFSLLHVAAAAN